MSEGEGLGIELGHHEVNGNGNQSGGNVAEGMVTSDAFATLSIRQLREECTKRGLAIRGRKDEVTHRLEVYEQARIANGGTHPSAVHANGDSNPTPTPPSFSNNESVRLIEVLCSSRGFATLQRYAESGGFVTGRRRKSTAELADLFEEFASVYNDPEFTPDPPSTFASEHPNIHGKDVRIERSGSNLRNKALDLRKRFVASYKAWEKSAESPDPNAFSGFASGNLVLVYFFQRAHESPVLPLLLDEPEIVTQSEISAEDPIMDLTNPGPDGASAAPGADQGAKSPAKRGASGSAALGVTPAKKSRVSGGISVSESLANAVENLAKSAEFQYLGSLYQGRKYAMDIMNELKGKNPQDPEIEMLSEELELIKAKIRKYLGL
eukprot:CAMPEP_0182449462 /NCGR_PEP_ID=MMETSP1172-20130603/34608_1 /TAXON_ID=708627 /ORGANISM="Timspurckia oligopyrenoides, Strain CCMP3278" /LENGTH=379 /DNA_ID=CAMNT_0024646753 /DNA_START=38 /DNA_END=1177 /DNA_ORIENTATION=-